MPDINSMKWSMPSPLRALVVGRAGMDLAPEPAGTAIEDALTFSTSLGGSAANIAVGLSKLGAQASLFTALSADPVGTYCINELAKYGVDTKHVIRTGGDTRSSLALTEARVANHRTIIYRNGASDFALAHTMVDDIIWEDWNTLVVTGTALAADPSRAVTFAVMEAARDHGVIVVLDIDYRPYSWAGNDQAKRVMAKAAELSVLVVGNEEEFALLAGSGDGFQCAKDMGARASKLAIYKRGPKGGAAICDGAILDVGAFTVDALKPTGAGDSFMAALLVSLSDGDTVATAMTRGAAAAAIVVSRPGCAPAMPNAAEIEGFLLEHQSDESGA